MICVHSGVCSDSRRSLDAKGYDRLRLVERDMTVAGKRFVDCTVLETESIADAEDSSYDSDYDVEDLIPAAKAHSQVDQVSASGHAGVSRTSSDTLAAEFAEYVTTQESPPIQSPGYAARVEFALKLGYTERLVQIALEKLGPNPEQNELLAELIKLGASSLPKFENTLDESDTMDTTESDFTSYEAVARCSTGLRQVVIDGSNVAMSHGNKEVFSCRGIKICVDWFKARGHREITVFVPKWRKEASKIDNPIIDQEILGELERDRLLVFTPSRLVAGKRMVCYDDRYILKLAAETDGIVVSNDNYRDLAQESPEFQKVVKEKILMYTFVNDRFMPPDDPLGRNGPTLENFLRTLPKKLDPAPPCPYAKKCTYGNKCKFQHPERGPQPQKSVTEKLVEHVQKQLQARNSNSNLSSPSSASQRTHQPLCKSRSTVTSTAQAVAPVTKSKSAENVAGKSLVANLEVLNTNLELLNESLSKLNTEWDNWYERRLEKARLCQRRQYQQASQTGTPFRETTAASSRPQHRPLTRHYSNELPYRVGANCDPLDARHCHPQLTRIASAPDSYQAPPLTNSNIGSKTLWTTMDDSPVANIWTRLCLQWFGEEPTRMLMDEKTEILNSLRESFHEEDVKIALDLHPFETDPYEIYSFLSKSYKARKREEMGTCVSSKKSSKKN
ncbi:zinc finger CCCH-type containing protein regnase 1 isoform X2 [Halictus rubicundus]|uniref:zinc finger CCCH-type containing protein regnase 1 isoform X2 n=1 Tax=Halictus rubicundus TaxID=77578 RepID=UPI0040367DDA